jgi:predicted TIM-barrel fold metal-dependent hydrolase
MIDTNVNLFRWPYRRLIGDDAKTLASRLRARGVTQAWAGSYEALLNRDIAGVNLRLADACKRAASDFFVPFGCVNPKSPDWQEDLRRCHEVHHMAGIRLFPNYHGYTLDDPAIPELISSATDHKLIVQIALSMEDTRTQQTVIPRADPAPLASLLESLPRARVVFLNSGHWNDDDAGEGMAKIRRAENAYFDIAMNEGVGGLGRLIDATSPRRVVFGSHSPFYYFESARLKVREAGLSHDLESAILEKNAQALLSERV